MIVQCPNCQSKSRVDDAGAARGARVRCASCAHVFLPTPAMVSPKAAPAAAAQVPAVQANTAEEEFGGKTSLFTGVIPRDLVGLTADGPPPQAPKAQLPEAMGTAPTKASSASPVKQNVAPAVLPTNSDADEGFGANRTQAIDVSQLAAFSAKMPASFDPVRGLSQSGPTPAAPPAAAKPKPGLAPISAAPVSLSDALADKTTLAQDASTAIVGTREPGLLSAGVTYTSRVLGGLSAVLGLCGLIFFTAGNAVYAQAGLMGGSAIDISEAQSPSLAVEQVTSALYTLADGHEALVALGFVGNPSDAQGLRMEVQFTLSDEAGNIVGQARGPVGAVLSLEELATITLPDSAAAELRRRVQDLPPMAPHSHDRKFMAVIKDPKHPLTHHLQSLSLAPALPAEPAPELPPAAANVPTEAQADPFLDPELPQSVLPAPPQAVSALPSETGDARGTVPAAKPRKKAPSKVKKRR